MIEGQPKQKVIEVNERKEAERHLILFATFAVAIMVIREVINVYYYFMNAVPKDEQRREKDIERGHLQSPVCKAKEAIMVETNQRLYSNSFRD